jgi:hypothetical protein
VLSVGICGILSPIVTSKNFSRSEVCGLTIRPLGVGYSGMRQNSIRGAGGN